MTSYLTGTGVLLLAGVLGVANVTSIFSQENLSGETPGRVTEVNSYSGPWIESGFLFVDGVFYPPPYSFQHSESIAKIQLKDGRQFSWSLNNGSGTGHKVRNRDRTEDRERNGDDERARRIEHALANDRIVVVWPGESAITIEGYSQAMFLSWLVTAGRAMLKDDSRPEWLTPGQNLQIWNDKFSSFQGSSEFDSRARAAIAKIHAAVDADVQLRSAKKLFDNASYPLLALSMLTIAVTMGHLIGCHSTMVKCRDDSHDSIVTRDVVQCIALISTFALIDLTWTVLAARAGQMHELNPVARHLLSTPSMLVVFKFITTACALVILYRWKSNRFAKRAIWWSCLICMMVAVRWVLQTGII